MTRAALVTGGSCSIGFAIARMLAGEGYALTKVTRRADRLETAVDPHIRGETRGASAPGVASRLALRSLSI